ncbi:MAG: hypothetical protein K0T01_803 [Acidimicrobiia bacterium]|jgi:uncharacterized Ntn-hydrolase superfamily protein|nr:hypothetical protein [Acidimicrobiia bacterium]
MMRPDYSYGLSTYSIVGADPEARECGVAVQSKFLAVGAFVPWARGGVGAVATQAYGEITYGSRGLDLLESGLSPENTIDRLTGNDDLRSHRQVGVVAADGRSASYTGEECFEHAVSVTGDGFAAQGNILTNPDVPLAMADTFRGSSGRLADRLLAALIAGEAAGGEKRGMESAALLVVRPGGGYGGNHDRWLDLRIDHSDTPIEDLRGLLDLHTLYFGKTEEGELLAFDEGLQNEVRRILDSIGWWDPGKTREDNLQGWLGWHNLEERWMGPERLDPVVLGELRSASNA